jgi:head-tail adaptor
MIAPTTSIGRRPHRVTFENPGPSTPDGDGGYIEGPPTLVASAFVQIRAATGGDQELVHAGTVLSHRSYIVSGPYQPGITTTSTMRFLGRAFNVIAVVNIEERGLEMVLVCDEITSPD